MSRVENQLTKGEEVIYQTRLHWTCFILPAILTIFTFGFAVFWLIWVFLERMRTEFALTNKRVVIYNGVISNNSFEMQLNKIEGVIVKQGLLERIGSSPNRVGDLSRFSPFS